MIELSAGSLRAAVHPEAGMLVSSLRDGEHELLHVRATPAQWREKGTTTGVPLLYPWANRLASDPWNLAAAKRDEHGLAKDGLPRARGPWTVEEQSGSSVTATLDWPADEPGFPFAHTTTITHALDDTGLTTAVRIEGDGAGGVPVSFGWHPYVAIDRDRDALVLPAMRRHLLDARGLPTGETRDEPARDAPLGADAIDALFDAPNEPLRAGRLELHLLHGYAYAQVWSPPGEPFACLEPMTAPTNALVTSEHLARAPHEASFRLATGA